MIESKDIAIICVTYNPDVYKLRDNIKLHLQYLDKIYIIDNSDLFQIQNSLDIICKNSPKCELISMNGNKGIAHALNVGCKIAISNNYKWVLTLDQDSKLSDNFIFDYLEYLNKLKDNEISKIGILTCNMSTWNYSLEKRVEKVRLCWTSGALMNLLAYNKVGGFDDDLFIDGVDFDLCAKFYMACYKMIRLNYVMLNHNLGCTIDYKLFNHHLFYVTHHNSIRRYYMTRNSLYLNRKYGKVFSPLKTTFLSILKIGIKILLFESDKISKFKAIVKGINDYRHGKLGKCNLY